MSRRSSARKKLKKLPPLSGRDYVVRGRIWLDGVDGTFLGHGRVVLMERIREHGSITRAAKSMDMSYRHAWRLIDSMNRQSPQPYVITLTGGRDGGGTVVTPEGERAIALFWKLDREFREFLDSRTETITFKETV